MHQSCLVHIAHRERVLWRGNWHGVTWAATRRYMFKYDSTHGVYKGDVVGSAEGLFIDGNKIHCYSAKCGALPLCASVPCTCAQLLCSGDALC